MKRNLWFALGLLAWLCAPARAQLSLLLTPTPVSAAPGDTLTFSATLSNSGVETVELVSAGGVVDGPSLEVFWDDSGFLGGLPKSLLPGGSYTADLSIQVGSGASPGSYTGTYSVEGEAVPSGLIVFGTGEVALTVAAAIPEPATLWLLGWALPLAGLAARRRPDGHCSRGARLPDAPLYDVGGVQWAHG